MPDPTIRFGHTERKVPVLLDLPTVRPDAATHAETVRQSETMKEGAPT